MVQYRLNDLEITEIKTQKNLEKVLKRKTVINPENIYNGET